MAVKTKQKCECPDIQLWNAAGQNCYCPDSTVWDGKTCNCPAGQIWGAINGLKSCVCPGNGTIGGLVKDGTKCKCADPLAVVSADGQKCNCPAGTIWNKNGTQCDCDQTTTKGVVWDPKTKTCGCPVGKSPVNGSCQCVKQLTKADGSLKECGSDGCGGKIGPCKPNSTCTEATFVCECAKGFVLNPATNACQCTDGQLPDALGICPPCQDKNGCGDLDNAGQLGAACKNMCKPELGCAKEEWTGGACKGGSKCGEAGKCGCPNNEAVFMPDWQGKTKLNGEAVSLACSSSCPCPKYSYCNRKMCLVAWQEINHPVQTRWETCEADYKYDVGPKVTQKGIVLARSCYCGDTLPDDKNPIGCGLVDGKKAK